jgi:hypothetical protein
MRAGQIARPDRSGELPLEPGKNLATRRAFQREWTTVASLAFCAVLTLAFYVVRREAYSVEPPSGHNGGIFRRRNLCFAAKEASAGTGLKTCPKRPIEAESASRRAHAR